MGIDYRTVEGPSFAADASALLQAAWKPPAPNYSTGYLRWQLSFPGPCPPPAIAASAYRRRRFHLAPVDVVVVSFVVDPGSRNQGIAGGLSARLLEAIRVQNKSRSSPSDPDRAGSAPWSAPTPKQASSFTRLAIIRRMVVWPRLMRPRRGGRHPKLPNPFSGAIGTNLEVV